MVFWIPAFSEMKRFAITEDTARRSSLFNLLYASAICRVNEKPPGSITLDLDLHGMIVLNAERVGHCNDLTDEHLLPEALSELGKLLNRACKSIKGVDLEVDTVLITSLTLGENSRHLHFHLIPKRKNEKVRTVAAPDECGGGMFFIARKEIVVDTYKDLWVKMTLVDTKVELKY